MKYLLALILLVSNVAWADSMTFDVGLGVFNSGLHSLSETKLVKLGLQEDVWYNLKQKASAGFWLDNAGNGRTDSEFGAYQLGFEVRNPTLLASVFFGPAFITTPDVYLGGHLQFNTSLFLGVPDDDNNAIGVFYNHFSSAGLEMPNMGRDFVGAGIKFNL